MTSLLHRLSLRRKFLLFTLIAGLALCVPCAVIVAQALADLKFARSERRALPPARALVDLVQSLQEHRLQALQLLGGDDDARGPRAAAAKNVDAIVATLSDELRDIDDPGIKKLEAQLAESWRALDGMTARRASTVEQSLQAHVALLQQAMSLLDEIAFATGVVLHPSADGYFLQSAVLEHLPRVADLLGQMEATGVLLSTGSSPRGEAMLHMTFQVEQAEDLFSAAARDLELATEASAPLARTLESRISAARASVPAAFAAARQLAAGAAAGGVPINAVIAKLKEGIGAQHALIAASLSVLDEGFADREARARHWVIGLAIGLAVFAGLALTLSRLMASAASRPIEEALGLAEAVAGGDLTRSAEAIGTDEAARLLRAMDRMCVDLRAVVTNVRDNAVSVAESSAQIERGNQDLSQRTEQQAAALQQTAATIEELCETVRRNADHAQQARNVAAHARAQARESGQLMQQLALTMNRIQDGSSRIAAMVTVIDEIAFQTNVLALNASVEAAHAGEGGRGFAVVASEVRRLAQKAADEARAIKVLIAESSDSVQEGSQAVATAGAAVAAAVQTIQQVSDLAEHISEASQQQSAGVAQAGQALAQMDETTQRNAALAEQSAAAAQGLKEQAERLLQAVSAFQVHEVSGDLGAEPAAEALLASC